MFISKRLWINLCFSAALVLLITALLYPVLKRARDVGEVSPSCHSNLKQIGLALLQYVEDYDQNLPLVATSAQDYGWAEALVPYSKTTHIFQCPSESSNRHAVDIEKRRPQESGYTDYYYNSLLNGRHLKTIGSVPQIISLGDGNDGTDITDARYARTALPKDWRENKNSPAYRHLDGANYAFVDGHVKWIEPQSISNHWKRDGYYFEPKKQ